MNTTKFELTNYDGIVWWKYTFTVSGLSNIMVYVKVRSLNDLPFLYHLESIGAIQLEETKEVIHP